MYTKENPMTLFKSGVFDNQCSGLYTDLLTFKIVALFFSLLTLSPSN